MIPSEAAERRDPRERIGALVVGRKRELELLLAACHAGRDIVLEGPPGTSKTTMLRAITGEWGIPLMLVEGNTDLTPAKLIGHHDPARVLREGFTSDTFVPGPLVEAMQAGGFLYVEELNRAPEDALNTLLTAIADRELAIPRTGVVRAAPSFRVVASMNPYDNVGTVRLSTSITDRLCRLEIGYQDEAAEREIVARRVGPPTTEILSRRLVDDGVAIVRATRHHPAVRQGSSVRGAIDLVLLARELARSREVEASGDRRYADLVFDAMIVALSGRLVLDDALDTDAVTVLREIWEGRFQLALAEPG